MRIKEILKEKGLTQVEFANQLGITRVGLNQLINGKPSYTTLEKLAKVLKVEIWELFVSPVEVANRNTQSKNDFTALIRSNGCYYSASTLSELKAIVSDLENNK